MFIKDLFDEMIRRMEWARDRKLVPEVSLGPLGYTVEIPVDESLRYVVKINGIEDRGVLVTSFFPDGEPHHCIGISGINPREAAALVDAAALIAYGKLLISGTEGES